MNKIYKLGGYSIGDKWKNAAKNEPIEYEEYLEYKVSIGQHKKLLTYVDGEDRVPILLKHEDKVKRTREALLRARIPFQEKSYHQLDKDWKNVRKGFDREERYLSTFEYTVAPDKVIEYVREACRESQAAQLVEAKENEAFGRMSTSSAAKEFASEIAEKAAEYIHDMKQKYPTLLVYRINCSTGASGIGFSHENERQEDYCILFEYRGMKKLDRPEQRALNDLSTQEIYKAMIAMDEVDSVYVTPTDMPYDDDYFISQATVCFVLDENNREKQLKEW